MKLTPEQIAQRAEQADATPVDYYLGGGSNRADSKAPYAPMRLKDGTKVNRASDCSNFVCWSSGVDKHDKTVRNSKGQRFWWGTDNIVADATGKQRRWKKLDKPVRGCTVVYGGHRRPNGTWRYGHCGIVVNVASQTTVDCASGPDNNAPNIGDAITRQSNLSYFWRNDKAIFVLPVEEAP